MSSLSTFLRALRRLRSDVEAARASEYRDGYLEALSALEELLLEQAWDEGDDSVDEEG